MKQISHSAVLILSGIILCIWFFLMLSYSARDEPNEPKPIESHPAVTALAVKGQITRPCPILEPTKDDPGYEYNPVIPLDVDLQEALFDACQEFNVDFSLMLAIIQRETKFSNITGDNGASVGYCQIQARWWRGLMAQIGAHDLTIPVDNFRTGCAIMAHLTGRYGNTRDALTAYNTGKPGTSQYANAVLASAEKWREQLD